VTGDPHILVLAGAGGIVLDEVLRSARSVTSRLSVVHVHAWSPVDVSRTRAAWEGQFVGAWHDCPTLAAACEAIRAVHRSRPLHGIATFSELLIQPQADLAHELGLPGNPPQTVRAAQNKLLQRTVLRDAGVLRLRFHPIRRREDLGPAAESVGFPAVLKPAYGVASMSVSRVTSARALADAYERAIAAAAHSPFLVREDLHLLEELLVGDHWYGSNAYADYCSVESLVQDGELHHLGVVDRLRLRHGYVEEGCLFPSVLPPARQAEVTDHATRVIRALGLRNGAAHTEIKLTPDGPRCIEVNARLGGPMGRIFKAATDHDIVASILRISAGLPVDPTVHVRRAACFRSIPGPGERMRVAALADPAEVQQRLRCLEYLRLRFRRGAVVDSARYPHIATLLVTGADATGCLDNVAEVESALALRLEPVEREHVLLVDRLGYDRYRLPDGRPALDPARHRVTLVTLPDLVGQARAGECAEVLGVDLWNAPLRDALCESVHREVGVDRLLAFTERLLLPTAHLRERLGIPGPTVAQMTPFRDKVVMKRTAQAGSLPVASGLPIARAADARRLLDRHGRIVLKPREGSGSVGVHLVDSPAALEALSGADLGGYLAEEHVEGEMLHVDAAVHRGELHTAVVSRYLSSTLSHADGRPLSSVTVGDPSLDSAARRFAGRTVEAFGVEDGVLHLELFRRPDGVLVFNEVAARTGGAGVVPAVQAVTGVNLHEAMVRLALGEEPSRGHSRRAPAAGWFLWYGRRGRLVAVRDAAVPPEWILHRRVAASPGEHVRPSGFSGTGLVTYVVGGRDEAEVRARLAFIEARTAVQYDRVDEMEGVHA
jgi:biotin carboxylase